MSKLQSIKLSALIGACALALNTAANAQDQGGFDVSSAPAPAAQAQPAASQPASLGTINLGIGGTTNSNPYYGRYNGMPESGVGFLSSWNLGKRDAWDSGSTQYYTFTGDNVNVGNGEGFAPEGTISLTFGDQGSWSVFGTYDAMSYRAADDFTSILDSKGNLSPGYVSALQNLGANGPLIGVGVATKSSTYFGSLSTKYYPIPGAGTLSFKAASVGSTVGYGLGTVTYPSIATSNYDLYLASLNELTTTVGTRRDKGTVGGTVELGDWKLGAIVSHEHKEGTLEQSMTTAGSNAGFVTFPMPVDYDTDTYTTSANYDTDVLQAHFSYQFSNFIDHNSGYAFEGWNFSEVQQGSAYSSYQNSGIYSLPPSNQAHTLKGEVGYNVTPTTRINGTLVYGLQLQNQSFVSPTLDQFTLSNFSSYFERNPSSLNGLVQTWFGNVTVNSRPSPEWNLKFSYTVDARDPSTKPMAIYGDPTDSYAPTTVTYAAGAAGNPCTPTTVSCAVPFARLAVPESWTKQTLALNVDYRLDEQTRFSLGYTFKDDERSNAITHQALDNTASAKVLTSIIPNVTASLGYSHSERTASAPDFSLWEQQIISDCVSNVAGVYQTNTLGCQEIPYYEAPRTQDAVTALVSDTLGAKGAISLVAKWTNNQYHDPDAYAPTGAVSPLLLPSVGVNRDYSIEAGPDFNYKFGPDLDMHAYYTFLRTYRDMRALNDEKSPTIAGVFEYGEATTYDIHTAGVGGTWQVNEKVKLVGDYIFTYGSLAFAQNGSWNTDQKQAFGGDPSLYDKSADNQIRLHAVWDYSPATSYYVGYQFDSVAMTDWALVGKVPGQVLTGNLAPQYNVSFFSAGVRLSI